MAQNVATSLSCRLEISGALPEDFPGSRIKEHPICTYRFPFGYLCSQEIESDDYTLYYHVIRSVEYFPYTITLDPRLVSAIFVLGGNLECDRVEDQGILLKQSEWIMVEPAEELMIRTRTKGVVQYILISFGGKLLQEHEALFPLLSAFREGQPVGQEGSHYLPLETRVYLQDILHCKHESEWRRHFIDNRVGDILFSILVSCSGSNPLQDISQDDLGKIREAERIISEDITQHLALNQLAEKIGMSLTKFKELFKKVYDQTPSDYLRKLRLSMAVVYLESRYSVKEAAYKSGWRPAVLIEAFREMYHTTPGRYYKQRNKGCK